MLLDPYAKYVKGRARFAQRDSFEHFQKKVGGQGLLSGGAGLGVCQCAEFPTPAGFPFCLS